MRIVSLNVNGLRSFDRKNGGSFNEFCLNVLEADIVCLQEVKGSKESLAKYHALADYHAFTSILVKGRHGVTTLVRKSLYCSRAQEVLGGRILKTFHGDFVLYNCYMPYCDEARADDRSRVAECYDLLWEEVGDKRVVLCGDFNATYSMLDHYQYKSELDSIVRVEAWGELPKTRCTLESVPVSEWLREKRAMLGMAGTLEQVERAHPRKTELPYHFFSTGALERHFFGIYQRRWMKQLMGRFLDTFRMFSRELEQYTCWNAILGLRPANLGARIDYVLCTRDVECTGAGIMQDVRGSDHCPVYAILHVKTRDGPENLLRRSNNLLDLFRHAGKSSPASSQEHLE